MCAQLETALVDPSSNRGTRHGYESQSASLLAIKGRMYTLPASPANTGELTATGVCDADPLVEEWPPTAEPGLSSESEADTALFAEPCPGELTGDSRATILALYDEYRPRLFRYLGSMHVGRDAADEVIQETFMRLTAALLRANEIGNIQGWVVRVAHNLAIDFLKRRDPVMPTETAVFLIENRADPALSPEEAYCKKEQFRRVESALLTLKPLHRQCFQMRAHGFRYKDIGLALGISEQRAAFVVKQSAVRLAAICE